MLCPRTLADHLQIDPRPWLPLPVLYGGYTVYVYTVCLHVIILLCALLRPPWRVFRIISCDIITFFTKHLYQFCMATFTLVLGKVSREYLQVPDVLDKYASDCFMDKKWK